jgi:hypothetical protein
LDADDAASREEERRQRMAMVAWIFILYIIVKNIHV